MSLLGKEYAQGHPSQHFRDVMQAEKKGKCPIFCDIFLKNKPKVQFFKNWTQKIRPWAYFFGPRAYFFGPNKLGRFFDNKIVINAP